MTGEWPAPLQLSISRTDPFPFRSPEVAAGRGWPRSLAILPPARIAQGKHRTILAPQLTAPPRALRPASGEVGEVIIIDQRPDVFRRRFGEWVSFQQRQHFRRTLQQPVAEVDEPGVLSIIAERREPHLPVQS